jgi:hypothetical protein
MSDAGKRLLKAAEEMCAIARGEAKPARIHAVTSDCAVLAAPVLGSSDKPASPDTSTCRAKSVRPFAQSIKGPLDMVRRPVSREPVPCRFRSRPRRSSPSIPAL